MLVFYKSVPRFVLLKALKRSRWLNASRSGAAGAAESTPPLPTERWVRIRPKLAGVCGSDLATLGEGKHLPVAADFAAFCDGTRSRRRGERDRSGVTQRGWAIGWWCIRRWGARLAGDTAVRFVPG